jgi:hypothetical protein
MKEKTVGQLPIDSLQSALDASGKGKVLSAIFYVK